MVAQMEQHLVALTAAQMGGQRAAHSVASKAGQTAAPMVEQTAAHSAARSDALLAAKLARRLVDHLVVLTEMM